MRARARYTQHQHPTNACRLDPPLTRNKLTTHAEQVDSTLNMLTPCSMLNKLTPH